MTCEARFLLKASLRLALILPAIGSVRAQPPKMAARSQSEVAYQRGSTADQAGRRDDAIAAYSQAIELDPANGLAWLARGTDYLALQDWPRAASDLEQAAKLLPADAEPHTALGQVFSHIGKQEEALAEFTRAIQLRPDHQPSYRGRGLTRVKLGLYREAIQDFDFCLASSPASADLYIERAVAYGAADEYRQAMQDLTAALRIQPDNLRALWVRGAIRELLDDLQGALTDYTDCIRHDPKDVRFRLARGSVYQCLMKHTLSLEDRDEAVKLAPENPSAYLDRADSYWNLGKVDEALADRTSAVRLAPATPRTWIARGTTYLRLGRYPEALADLKQAFRLDALDGETQKLMAVAQKGVSEAGVVVASGVAPIPPSPSRSASTVESSAPTLPLSPQVEPKIITATAVPAQSVPVLTTPVQPPRRKFAPDFLSSRSTAAPTWPLLPPPVERPNAAIIDTSTRSVVARLLKIGPPPEPVTPRPTERTQATARNGPIQAESLAASALVPADHTSRNRALAKTLEPALSPTIKQPAPASLRRTTGAWADSTDTAHVRLPSSRANAFRSTVSDNESLDRTAKSLFVQGQRLVTNRHYARAIEVLTEALKVDPRSHHALTLRGYARLESKQYKEALEDFNQAIHWNAFYIDAYRCRAYARSILGDKTGAEEDENKVSELLRPAITSTP